MLGEGFVCSLLLFVECFPNGEVMRGAGRGGAGRGGAGRGVAFLRWDSGLRGFRGLFGGEMMSSRLWERLSGFLPPEGELRPAYGGGGSGREATGEPLGGAGDRGKK